MSNKEIELIEFLNHKLDVLNKLNNDLNDVVINDASLSKDNYNAYVAGFNSCIRDVKKILLKLLKGEYVVYDEKESSKIY